MSNHSGLSKKFYQWAQYLKITSKEKGIMSFSPKNWFHSQKFLIRSILSEIESNSEVRTFIVLKPRQVGVTHVLHALNLYWVSAIKGISLGFLCHSYEARPKLREIVRQMYLGLPDNMKNPVLIDNRELMLFANGSQIQFMHISPRETTKQNISRSQSLVCLHATEVAYYDNADPSNEVLKSLLISLSKAHPARYCILESTANGFNSFCDRWYEAKNNPAIKTIFIGWWMRDDYRLPRSNPLYQHYSYPFTKEEKERIKIVKKLYGHDISMEQMAWYRKTLETDFNNDLNYCLQELPFHEDDAFRLTGLKFFETDSIIKAQEKLAKKPLYFNVHADYNGIYVEEGFPRDHNLQIFELPKEKTAYFIGADPSWGVSQESDRAVISVWKGYNDKIIQVAEFADRNLGTIEFAKLCLFLASFYKGAYINIEVQGGGQAVIKEINNFRKNSYDLGVIKWNARKEKEYDVSFLINNVKLIKEYLFYRGDTLRKHYVKHWVTTHDTKRQLLFNFKSCLQLGLIEVKSKELLEEMKWFIQDGTYLGAQYGKHDDRVMAAAMAIEYWRRHGYHNLPSIKEVTEVEEQERNKEYLTTLGLYNLFEPFLKKPA